MIYLNQIHYILTQNYRQGQGFGAPPWGSIAVSEAHDAGRFEAEAHGGQL